MRTAARILPVVLATLLLAGLVLPTGRGGAVPDPGDHPPVLRG